LQNEKDYEFLLAANINRFFIAQSPAETENLKQYAIVDSNFDQGGCFPRFSSKASRVISSPFKSKLFTPLFSVACKMRMYLRFFSLSTVVDNSVRNLSAFSFLKSEG